MKCENCSNIAKYTCTYPYYETIKDKIEIVYRNGYKCQDHWCSACMDT